MNALDGTFTYLPEENFIGEDSFVYQASDGALLSDSTQVRITVQPTNDPPDAVRLPDPLLVDLDDGLQTFEFDMQTGIDEEDQIIASIRASALDGSFINAVTVERIGDKRGRLQFMPLRVGVTGIQLRIQDNGGTANGGVDSTFVTLNIEIIQDLLIPVADTFVLSEDQWLSVSDSSLRDNDFFGQNKDPEVILVEAPQQGLLSLNPDGTFNYQPNSNYYGEDRFTYRLRLSGRLSEEEVPVVLQILPVNDPPEISGLPTELNLERTSGKQEIPFRLTPGPGELAQSLRIRIAIGDPEVLSDLRVERTSDTTAIFSYTPNFPGNTSLTIFVQDDGSLDNGGVNQNQANIQTLVVEVAPNGIGALVANALSLRTIKLDWEDISINEAGFLIERSLDEGETFTLIAQVEEGVSTYEDQDMQIGISTYCYRVRGFNEVGFSAYSNVACAQLRNNEILLPNTFTPNGDNRNDRFILRSLNVREVEFRIFDRKGALVFTTSDVEEATRAGWDGGQEPPGVYVWAVRVKFDDGVEKNARGKINLVR